MSAHEANVVCGYLTGFEFCTVIDENGRVRAGTKATRIEIVRGPAPASGSFAVQIDLDDEDLCFGPEWKHHDRDLALFEPFTGELEMGQRYLWGQYDSFHRWLEGAWVDLYAGELGGKLVFHGDNERPDLELCPTRTEAVIVGRFIGILRGDLAEGFGQIPVERGGHRSSRKIAGLEASATKVGPRREDFQVIEGRAFAA